MMHDVFVSYSNKDKAIADTIVAAMENNQIRCWYAPRDIKPSEDWGKAITSAIEESRVFLIIFSNHANQSQRVLDEVNLAISQQAIIFPFRVENLEPQGAMKLHLSSRHWLDAYEPSWESYIKKLIKEVSANLKNSIDEHQIVVPAHIGKETKQQRNLTRIIVGIVIGAIVITTGWFGWSSLNQKDRDIAAVSEAETSTPQENLTVQEPELTDKSTATSTPIPDREYEANAFSEPILAVVKNRPPDFADDFSQVDPSWFYNPPYDYAYCSKPDELIMNITDGSVKCSVGPGCKIGILTHTDMQYANYVLQLDINFQQAPLEFGFGMWPMDSYEGRGQLSFNLNSRGYWVLGEIESGDPNKRIEGTKNLDFSKPVTVTIISKTPTILVYLDSDLLGFYETQQEYAGTNLLDFEINCAGDILNITKIETLELDNVKIWDLDKIRY